MSQIVRSSKVHPGYSCGTYVPPRNPCAKAPGCQHGWHGDEWWYAVVTEEAGLRLRVSTNLHDGRLVMPYSDYEKGPSGTDLSMHLNFPSASYEDAILENLQMAASECDLLPSGKCHSGFSGALAARDLFLDHGDKGSFEQPESFWRALEAKFDSLLSSAHANRVDTKYVICDGCEGKGYRRKP